MPRLAILLAIPVIAAGCGGDDGQSREDYVAEADAICERINAEIEEINSPQPTDLESLRSVLDRGLEATRGGIGELESLDPPAEIEDAVEDFLGSAHAQEQALEDAREAGSFEDGARILQERIPPIQQARQEAAEEIGFEDCGRG